MNKYQEALENLKGVQITETETLCDLNVYETVGEDLNYHEFDVQESFSNLQKLITEREKYRWHSLRKEPDNLPEIDNEINVIYEPLITNTPGRRCVAYRVDEDCLDDLKRGFVGNFVLLAWKYIEEFEDEQI